MEPEKKKEMFHLLYNDKDGKFRNKEMEFEDFDSCENWLKQIGAKYWEIGFIDRDIRSALKQVLSTQ